MCVLYCVGENSDPRGPPNKPVPPHRTTLLHVVGAWLFEAASLDRALYAFMFCVLCWLRIMFFCVTALFVDQ